MRNSILFPENARDFKFKRWLSIVLRSFHLIGVAGVGAGFLYAMPVELWQNYLVLIVVTGIMMMSLEIWSNARWLLQIRGMASLLKLAVLSLSVYSGPQAWQIFLVILISGVISHAPAKLRYFSLIKLSADG